MSIINPTLINKSNSGHYSYWNLVTSLLSSIVLLSLVACQLTPGNIQGLQNEAVLTPDSSRIHSPVTDSMDVVWQQAVWTGNVNQIKSLLLANKTILLNTSLYYHKTLLQLALQQGDLTLASLLLENGTTVSQSGGNSQPALHSAIASIVPNPTDLVKVVLQYGGDVNEKDYRQHSPLHKAIVHTSTLSIIQLLLSAQHIDINTQNSQGETPLHFSIILNKPAYTRLLLAYPTIQVNITNDKGNTALHEATYHQGNTDIVELLLNKQADIHIKNHTGETALGIAKHRGYTAMIKLLSDRTPNTNTLTDQG